MSRRRLSPPEGEACLARVRPSNQKGGTLIAEDVTDRVLHEQRISSPDGYRPKSCPTCGGQRLHVHDYRERVLRAEPGTPVTRVARHVCVACGAIWQTLPVFLARCLWRTWAVVEHALSGTGSAGRWPRVPGRTRRRWAARRRRLANLLKQVFASSGAAAWTAIAGRLGPEASCADLIAAVGQGLAAVAALINRLQPHFRLL